MSLFDDIVSGSDGVYSITNRPDLVAETKLAVRQATLAAHRSDYYPRDRIELGLPLTSAALFQLDIPTYFPNWRAFSWLRPYDLVTGSLSSIVLGPDEMLAPDAILDEYLIEKVNIWYVAGNNINIKLEAAYGGLLFGYYANPVLSPEGSYESWIAREQPALIVLDAAKRVFESVGWAEQAARLGVMLFGPGPGTPSNPTGGEYALLKSSSLTGAGR